MGEIFDSKYKVFLTYKCKICNSFYTIEYEPIWLNFTHSLVYNACNKIELHHCTKKDNEIRGIAELTSIRITK